MKFSDSAARLAGLVPRLLGWPPGTFWNATPAELAAILSPAPEGEPLARSELEKLMERDTHG
ncbi:MAG: phage tail assembly chaperone [Candidatus Andeanibacterium colombiense]|uniref:Phage tail assembly chaperone n=1 Tax=Candidatus Andeanibacterium colombiense TaxID=3121345 RepID=A0AAJ6BM19_9SPHN|nr:MAG: phage tail assembly chaperone [Sphingomonadaceae bacterium]